MAEAARGVLYPYRVRLVLVYALSLVEFVLELLYPFTIGIAINGFLEGRGIGSVVPLTVVWLLQSAVGALYQITSSRLIANIHRTVSGEMILRERTSPDSTSEVAARVTMVEAACEALADVVPMLLSGVVGIVGSVVMLFVFDRRAGAVAVVLVVVVALLQWWFSVHAVDLNRRINSLKETQVAVIATRKRPHVVDYLRAITRLNVRFKDVETGVWTFADLFALAAVVLVLYLVAGEGAYNAGSIYAMITYVMTLTDSLENAPILVDEGAHFADVAARVAEVRPFG